MATSRQLLFRAGEIKQPKRREALIENAEKARISRKLVLLDDKVELDVPLDELAVHEPDARKLIAFLKAMEFSTLTTPRRRIFADRSVGGRRRMPPARAAALPSRPRGRNRRTGSGDLFAPATRRAQRPAAGGNGGQGREPQGHADLACRRARGGCAKTACRSQQVPDDPQARRSEALFARAHDAGRFAIDAKASSIDPMQAEICGIALALAPNDACYMPLAHKQSGDGVGLFDAGLAPDQIKESDALEALRPLLESAGILKIGFNIKFNAVMLAQAGITLRNYDDAQLMSYALDAGRNCAWARCARRDAGSATP